MIISKNQNQEYKVILFQNTPAQFHGRPEEVEKLTLKLQEIYDNSQLKKD